MSTFAFVFIGLVYVSALIVLYLIFRCKHDWEPVVERELPAVADVIDKAEVNRWGSAILTYRAGRRKFFAIISCKKCGAVQQFETLSGQDDRGLS